MDVDTMPSAVVVEVGGGYLRVIDVDTMPSAMVVEVGEGTYVS